MLKYQEEWTLFIYGVFVSPRGGLGGLLIDQRRGDRAVGSAGFCLTPVIAFDFIVRYILTMFCPSQDQNQSDTACKDGGKSSRKNLR
jgi:hypothetical protein